MSIHVQQPQPYDIVSDSIHIAGTAGGAFEATYNYRVSEGHDEVDGHFMPVTASVAMANSRWSPTSPVPRSHMSWRMWRCFTLPPRMVPSAIAP